MGNTWFTSDQHFWHANIIRYCDRPFSSVEEMNEALIRKHNEIVKPEDTVFHLGDFSLAFRAVELYAKRLNGKNYLVPGNHDFCHPVHKKSKKSPEAAALWLRKYVECGFAGVLSLAWRLPNDILLSHMPYKGGGDHADIEQERFADYRAEDKGGWLLHGHVHTTWKQKGRMINVGADQWDYAPVHMDQILDLIKKGPV